MRNDDGEIVDFVIEFVKYHDFGRCEARHGRARRSTAVRGASRLARVRNVRQVPRCRHDRIPYQGHRVQYADPGGCQRTGVDGKRRQAYWTVQVAKFGDGYISASRDITEVVLAEEATRAASAAGSRRENRHRHCCRLPHCREHFRNCQGCALPRCTSRWILVSLWVATGTTSSRSTTRMSPW